MHTRYSKDVSEVYSDSAFHLIITERNANILVFFVAPHQGQYLPLPSWVPNWSQPQINNASPRSMPSAYKALAGNSCKGRISSNTLSPDGVMLNRSVRLDGGEESYEKFKQSRNYAQRDLTAYVQTLVANVGEKHRLERQQLLLFYNLYHRNPLMVTLNANREFYDTWPKVLTTEIKDFYTSIPEPHKPVIESVKKGDKDKAHSRNALHDAAIGRTFVSSTIGSLGGVPWPAKVGDRIVIFLGGMNPILLRPSGDDNIVLGEAYTGEMMDGQLFEEPDVQVSTITLI